MAIKVNGYKYSFASVKLKANGQNITGLKSIDYSNAIERGKVRGTGIQESGRTRGQASSEAKIGFADLESYLAFITSLGDGYMEAWFDIVVSYAETGSPLITDTIVGCQIKKPPRTAAQGTEALAVDCELDCSYVMENGLKPYKDMEL